MAGALGFWTDRNVRPTAFRHGGSGRSFDRDVGGHWARLLLPSEEPGEESADAAWLLQDLDALRQGGVGAAESADLLQEALLLRLECAVLIGELAGGGFEVVEALLELGGGLAGAVFEAVELARELLARGVDAAADAGDFGFQRAG